MKLTNAQRRLLDRVKADGGAIRQVDMTAYENRSAHALRERGLLELDGAITSNIYGGSTYNHFTWVLPEDSAENIASK
ncbi:MULTISPECIES: hypothetical protein [Hyphomicrobiales]|jgi:hypothetical protein|uniref:hypothetical protein n=1 Tax=Hyphomicrobiales TaxID=356 RepID=UPI0010F671D5|nr:MULTISPECIES: hypothetical protein [Mesorhizobium]MBA3038670.1 hypothetical protein [Rhizobiaceae bacterium]MBN8949179.1 hypothetical protein [Rhizobium tropici]MBN8993630.1 hypothetical protein [Hyphomicrobiales bacterium]MBN9134532.1 hypothetical protein [Phyllobacterium sp.]MBN9217127.1 hypothetical protein [Mesorhizobium sp.]